MNDREAFDKVKKHLLTQGHRAMMAEPKRCVYLAANGDKCAIGILIEDYSPDLEKFNAREMNHDLGWGLNDNMLIDLQQCHDDVPIEDWATDLDIIEANYL
jgi:hypothetical protein